MLFPLGWIYHRALDQKVHRLQSWKGRKSSTLKTRGRVCINLFFFWWLTIPAQRRPFYCTRRHHTVEWFSDAASDSSYQVRVLHFCVLFCLAQRWIWQQGTIQLISLCICIPFQICLWVDTKHEGWKYIIRHCHEIAEDKECKGRKLRHQATLKSILTSRFPRLIHTIPLHLRLAWRSLDDREIVAQYLRRKQNEIKLNSMNQVAKISWFFFCFSFFCLSTSNLKIARKCFFHFRCWVSEWEEKEGKTSEFKKCD